MKRLICFVTLSLAVCLSGRIAYAQHGHGAGGGVPAAAMGSHGDADVHGNSGNASTAPSTGTEPKTASARLMSNQPLNTALTKALGNLVPSGFTLEDACKGFTNLGHCISAIHAANNHNNINFFCLREELTKQGLPMNSGITCPPGTTLNGAKSLGAAIRFFDPNADSKAEATKATKQANTDIDTASQGQT